MNMKYDSNGVPKIGGWLYLVAIDIIASIIMAVFNVLFSMALMYVEDFSFIFTMLKFEIFFNIVMFGYIIYVAALFITKKSNFPKHFIIVQIVSIIYYCFGFIIYRQLFLGAGVAFDMEAQILPVCSSIASIIVILYVIKSKRVEQTFIVSNGGGYAAGQGADDHPLERKCSYCAEWIKAEAVVCRFCGRGVNAEKPGGIDLSKPTDSARRQ